MILLLTNKRDLTMDYIVKELSKKNIPFYRLNTEDLPKYKIVFGIADINDWTISLKEKEISGFEVKAAYFRRPEIPQVIPSSLKPSDAEYIQNEWLSVLKNLYWRLDNKWLNSPTSIFLSEDKAKQLVIAKEIGFKIPNTYITNDYYSAAKLQIEKGIIAKPLKHALLSGTKEKVIFTSRVKPLKAKDSASISMAPIIFQNEINKKFDVRVTVVADKVFAVGIWSQVTKETTVDWRKGSKTDLKHNVINLPTDVESMCCNLLKKLDLKFGAIDFICDRDDNFWFLEINPNGQFAWIENKTDLPIAEAIVNELVKISQVE